MTKNSPRRNSNAQGLLLIPMQWTIVYFGHSVIEVGHGLRVYTIYEKGQNMHQWTGIEGAVKGNLFNLKKITVLSKKSLILDFQILSNIS